MWKIATPLVVIFGNLLNSDLGSTEGSKQTFGIDPARWMYNWVVLWVVCPRIFWRMAEELPDFIQKVPAEWRRRGLILGT